LTGGRAPILVVESDSAIGSAIAVELDADRFPVELAQTAEHARSLAQANEPKLVVLGDLGSGRGALELLGEIREGGRAGMAWRQGLPAIVIGSRAGEADVLRAFETGADDFLARPANYLELRARLLAVLRRSERAECHTQMRVGPLAIDPATRVVRMHDRSVSLRRLEFALLVHLAGDPERVFGKTELLRAVWGYRCCGSTRTVDSHASRLRRKLELDGDRRWVINSWGVGYRLV
jgi:DNA-binding response OmpR family regulator